MCCGSKNLPGDKMSGRSKDQAKPNFEFFSRTNVALFLELFVDQARKFSVSNVVKYNV